MKIAVILSHLSVGQRPLDFWYDNIYKSSRGLTGTDYSAVQISKELVERGHDVHLFTVHAQPNNKPDEWMGVKLYNCDDRFAGINDSFDVILSINDPNVFFNLTEKPLRICWEFLNDFPFARPGFDDKVDMWLAVCEQHRDYLFTQMPEEKYTKQEKWQILNLGCDPDWYEDRRVKGRIIWASSPDRGLHNLLEIFPSIKEAVPEAHLKVFYHFDYDHIKDIDPYGPNNHPHVAEMANRIKYCRYALEKLKPLGVEHVGSVSQYQMRQEFSEASVLAFPTDTIAFSEGFSVTTLQAHAGYCVPVITNQDCLGSIYKNSGAVIIDAPVRKNLKQYTNAVIRALTDQEFADNTIQKCRKFAIKHSWKKIAEQMEEIILKSPKVKK